MRHFRFSVCIIFFTVTIHTFAAPGDLKFTFQTSGPLAISTNGDLLMANSYSFQSRAFPSLATNWGLFEFQGFEGATILNRSSAFIGHYYLDGKMNGIHSVYAFDISTGARVGTFNASPVSAITADGILIANGGTSGFDVVSQRLLWTNNLTYLDAGDSLAIGANGTLYLRGRGLTAVDHLSGQVLWSFPPVDPAGFANNGAPGYPPVSIGPDGTIFFGSQSGTFYALNPDGTVRWDFIASGAIGAAAVISRENIVYLASQNGVFALDGETGVELWNYPLKNQTISTSPALTSDGTLYVGCDALLAIDAMNGQLKWSSLHPAGNADISVHPDGTILVSSFTSGRFDTVALEGNAPLATGGWTKARRDLSNSSSWQSTGTPVILYSTKRSPAVDGKLHFQVAASGSLPLLFQWFRNDALIPNATNSSLSVTAGSVDDLYTAKVSNAVGSATSSPGRRAFTIAVHSIGGYVTKSDNSPFLTNGSSIRLAALTRTNRLFLGWSGDITSPENSLTLTITNDLVLNANFETRPGDLLWKARVGLMAKGSCPALNDDGVFSASDSTIRSLDLRSGDLKWRFSTRLNSPPIPPVVKDSTVYVSTRDGLVALNESNGSIRWMVSALEAWQPSVSVDGTVFLANGSLSAIDPQGKIKWRREGEYGVISIAADGSVYLANNATLSRYTGSGVLLGRVNVYEDARPAIPVDQRIFHGSQYWDLSFAQSAYLSFTFDPPAIAASDGLLYFGRNRSFYGQAFTIEPRSLDRGFAVEGPFFPTDSCAIAADGTLYIPSFGSLVASNIFSGTNSWAFSVPQMSSPTHAPTIAKNGTVLFYSDRTLYAVKGTAPVGNGWWPKAYFDIGNTSCQQTSAPKISKDPMPQVFKVGEPAVFSVEAFGSEPRSYAWLSNGRPISGANAPKLSVLSASPDLYSVVVSNVFGVLTSRVAYVGYTLDLTTNGGFATLTPSQKVYRPGSLLTVSAIANRGNQFLGWTGTVESGQATVSIEVTNNLVLESVFEVPPGGLLWRTEVGDSFETPIVISNLVFTSSDFSLNAFDFKNGRKRWSFYPGGGSLSSIRVWSIAENKGALITSFGAIESLTGRLLWSLRDQWADRCALTSDGIRFAVEHDAAYNGHLRARDGATGAILASYEVNPSTGPPVIGLNNHAFVLDPNGSVLRFSTNSAEPPVALSIGAVPSSSPIFDSSGMMFLGVATNVWMIDPNTMQIVKTLATGASLIDRNIIYSRGYDANLRVGLVYYSLTNSKVVDFALLTSAPGNSIAEDGTLYSRYPTGWDTLIAYDTLSKRTNWVFECEIGPDLNESKAGSLTLGPDGTVYYTSRDGRLYAIRGTAPLRNQDWPAANGNPQQSRHVRPLRPAISSIAKSNSFVVMSFETQLGALYSVEAADGLFSGWTVISSKTGTGGPVNIRETNSVSDSRFYRVRAE